MQLWRKPKNRRLGRDSVLDVKRRAQPARQARRHRVVLALLLAILAAVSVALGQRGWEWARQKLMDSQLFALTSLEITTDGVWLKPDQIRQWTGVREGDNLLLIDMTQIRRELEIIPQVASVSVERVLPHALRIDVTEREPVLQIQAIQPEGDAGLASTVFYMDRAAVIMPPLPSARTSSPAVQAFEALPILRGLSNAELRPGTALHSRPIHGVLELLAAFEQSPLAAYVQLRLIDIASPETLRVVTGTGAEITFAYDRVTSGLDRWLLVHETGRRLAKAVASLDLAVTNNCPVLWLESSAVVPLKPQPAKPQRLRRNHV